MNGRYELATLGDEQLLAALRGLVRRENCAMADMLAHLAELDERRLFLDLGYPSLFAYCREALGFCKSSAGRRIAAARVCRRYPDAFVRVATGELQLSVLSVLGSYLCAENAAALLEACIGKSFEQVEELLAARFPRPDVRDSIRRLPDVGRRGPDIGSAVLGAFARETPTAELTAKAGPPEDVTLTAGAAASVAGAFAGCAQGEPQKLPPMPATHASPTADGMASIPAEAQLQTPLAALARERIEPLSAGRFGVHFTADAEFRDLLDEVRALASHGQPDGQLLPVLKRALETYRRELEKRRFAVGAKSRAVPTAGQVPYGKRTRRASASVRRAVYERDHGTCTFVSAEGLRCGAQQFLELDHVQPWALSGASTVDNLRLRCRAHNQHSARVYFGSAYMRAAVKRART